jgi:hypothetical protein
MMMPDVGRSRRLGVRTDDDRHSAMIERRHEPGRRQQAQAEQQREQRQAHQSGQPGSYTNAEHRWALARHPAPVELS